MSINEQGAQALAESLAKAGLVPGTASELIPDGFKPSLNVSVSYGEKAVQAGNFFRAGECKAAPHVSISAEAGAPADSSYMLILTDGDAPTPDDRRFAWWRHYVLSGLTESAGGRALTEYLGPGPKDDSKPHRYLFLVFREPAGLSLAKEDVGGEEFVQRRSFKPAEFAQRHGLQLVGLNWMTCAGDGWVAP